MKREDITHLATLARLELSEVELKDLESELSSIMSYVSVVTDIASDDTDKTQILGARHNVFRADVVTNKADDYTADLLKEMPYSDGRHMKVKKILNASE